MKRYIRSSNRYQYILDNIVDGNKIWNPLTGEYDTLSEARLEELKNPKPVLLPDFKIDKYYVYRGGILYYVSISGEQPSDSRVYRNAGRYKIYLDSFRGAALPYSNLYVADTETGKVYKNEITQGTSDFRRDLAELVDWLREGNTMG